MATAKPETKDVKNGVKKPDKAVVVIVFGGPRRRWPDDGVRVEKGER